jgi:cysteine synthase A
VIDRMIGVPDNASIATARLFSDRLGRRVGGSTGTNLWGALQIVAEMAAQRQPGSVVTLLCDSGDRYANTYFDDDWLSRQGFDLTEPTAVLDEFLASGHWTGATA